MDEDYARDGNGSIMAEFILEYYSGAAASWNNNWIWQARVITPYSSLSLPLIQAFIQLVLHSSKMSCISLFLCTIIFQEAQTVLHLCLLSMLVLFLVYSGPNYIVVALKCLGTYLLNTVWSICDSLLLRMSAKQINTVSL